MAARQVILGARTDYKCIYVLCFHEVFIVYKRAVVRLATLLGFQMKSSKFNVRYGEWWHKF